MALSLHTCRCGLWHHYEREHVQPSTLVKCHCCHGQFSLWSKFPDSCAAQQPNTSAISITYIYCAKKCQLTAVKNSLSSEASDYGFHPQQDWTTTTQCLPVYSVNNCSNVQNTVAYLILRLSPHDCVRPSVT